MHEIARLENCRRDRLKGVGKLGLKTVLRTSEDGAKATDDVNSRSNNLGRGATFSDTRNSRAKRVNKGKLLKCARVPDLPRRKDHGRALRERCDPR